MQPSKQRSKREKKIRRWGGAAATVLRAPPRLGRPLPAFRPLLPTDPTFRPLPPPQKKASQFKPNLHSSLPGPTPRLQAPRGPAGPLHPAVPALGGNLDPGGGGSALSAEVWKNDPRRVSGTSGSGLFSVQILKRWEVELGVHLSGE